LERLAPALQGAWRRPTPGGLGEEAFSGLGEAGAQKDLERAVVGCGVVHGFAGSSQQPSSRRGA
jgi:hypothetical protein